LSGGEACAVELIPSADQGRSALPVDGFEYSAQAFCVCAPIPIGARRDRSRACGTQTRLRFEVMGREVLDSRLRGAITIENGL